MRLVWTSVLSATLTDGPSAASFSGHSLVRFMLGLGEGKWQMSTAGGQRQLRRVNSKE